MQQSSPKFTSFTDPAALAHETSEAFVRLAKQAIEKKGSFDVALAGGNTPVPTYKLLAGPLSTQVEWNKVNIFFGDERYVPFDHPESGYKLIKESLLDHIPVPKENIFPIYTNVDSIDKVVTGYTKTLTDHFGGRTPRFDLILLGIGYDGHTTGLFPHTKALDSTDLVAYELHSPKQPPERITVTYSVLNNAENVIVMAGSDKAEIIAKLREGTSDYHDVPVCGVKPISGNLHIFSAK